MSDPLPCPICGNDAIMKRVDDSWFICCPNGDGGIRTQKWNSADKAITSWNWRTGHLASSGPAGELQEAIERRDHWFARAEEWKDASYKELMKRQAVEYERDTARQECEAQKARAIRAEGDRDELRSFLMVTREARDAAQAECQRLRGCLENLITRFDIWGTRGDISYYRDLAKQALTPAPDHAKGEQ